MSPKNATYDLIRQKVNSRCLEQKNHLDEQSFKISLIHLEVWAYKKGVLSSEKYNFKNIVLTSHLLSRYLLLNLHKSNM